MTKRALGIGFVAVGLAAAAQATTITHSASQAITAGNSVACYNAGIPATTANSYFRSFDLPSFGITNIFNVSSVDLGVEAVVVGSLASNPVTINLYVDTDGGAITGGDLLPIGSSGPVGLTSANNLSVVNFPAIGAVPAGATLAVEAFSPDGQPTASSFFVGSNAAGQTGPSYIAAAACGIPNPINLANIGFPGMHIVMNVTGTEVPEPASLTLIALGGLALLRRR